MWSPINHIPHRDLALKSTFVVLSTTNATTITLSATHLVYISESTSMRRMPAPAGTVKVGHVHGCTCSSI